MNTTKSGKASDGCFMIPIRYSNQDFDEKQARAAKLAEDGRNAGTIPPGYGYTAETWAQAEAEYKAAVEEYNRNTSVDTCALCGANRAHWGSR